MQGVRLGQRVIECIRGAFEDVLSTTLLDRRQYRADGRAELGQAYTADGLESGNPWWRAVRRDGSVRKRG